MKVRKNKRRRDRMALLGTFGRQSSLREWEERAMRNMKRMHTDAAYREKIARLIF